MLDQKLKTPPIKDSVILHVYVAACGRCSFYGCPDYVLEEPLTNKKAILGNIAHIVADSRKGPRGDDPLPMHKRSEFENLMLMCTKHHTFIDKKENVPDYSVAFLRGVKHNHETRMKLQTGIPIDAKTHALRFIGQIRGKRVSIPDTSISPAIFRHEKRYIEKTLEIDLSSITDESDSSYWNIGQQKIDKVLNEEIFPKIERKDISRLSILALARIPLVAYLGFRLGDKIISTLYHKHKNEGEEWSWPMDGQEINFKVVKHEGYGEQKIALLVTVSGGDIEKVKQAVNKNIIYEIRPTSEIPRLTLINSPKTLENFRKVYRDFLSQVEGTHSKVEQINLFLAAPTSVALICGRELRTEVPKVVIYDLIDGQYKPTITLK